MSDYGSVRQEALEALDGGDARRAYQCFRAALDYPGPAPESFADALGVFARIADALAGPALVEKVRAAQSGADDPQALYGLGYELIEVGLPSFAASVLARANRIAPGQEAIVCELVCALERAMLSDHACAVLRAVPQLIESSFVCRYLLAFNAVMSGDLDAARKLMPRLDPQGDPERVHLGGTIAGMLERARAIGGVAPLDENDLRGWHFVLNGALLTHVSPYGPEVMRGRYAFVQDGYETCREGLRRLSIVLESWKIAPKALFAPPDRDSMALAHGAAGVLGLQVEEWPAAGRSEPGLIVVYDMGGVPQDRLESLAAHRPGQLLWAHASCWTAEAGYSPDVVTYLYQINVAPWGETLTAGPESHRPADTSPPGTLGAKIAAAGVADDALADGPALAELAEAARDAQAPHQPGGLRPEGSRRKQWLGSPVRSARFA